MDNTALVKKLCEIDTKLDGLKSSIQEVTSAMTNPPAPSAKAAYQGAESEVFIQYYTATRARQCELIQLHWKSNSTEDERASRKTPNPSEFKPAKSSSLSSLMNPYEQNNLSEFGFTHDRFQHRQCQNCPFKSWYESPDMGLFMCPQCGAVHCVKHSKVVGWRENECEGCGREEKK